MNSLLLKICLGIFAATNFLACIVTTDLVALACVNLVVAAVCLGIFLFMESKFSGIAQDLGISKAAARKLTREYFNYYKNVERISIYEYYDRSLANVDRK